MSKYIVKEYYTPFARRERLNGKIKFDTLEEANQWIDSRSKDIQTLPDPWGYRWAIDQRWL